ncbi:hypothetical protein D3C85_1220220 [compost metagenome]
MQACRAQGIDQPLQCVAHSGNFRLSQSAGFPPRERFNINVPKFDHCGPIKHLVTQAMCRFIHIHSADDYQVAWVGDGCRHTVDVIVLSMELNVITRLHG